MTKLTYATTVIGGMGWRSWLRHYATSWKVASIPNGVTGIFHWHNHSSHTMALGLTQFLTEMSTRNISYRVKVAGVYGWPYHLHVPTVFKSGSINLLELSGPVQACNGIAFNYSTHHMVWGKGHKMWRNHEVRCGGTPACWTTGLNDPACTT